MTPLELRTRPESPLEAGVITPEQFAGKTEAEISRLPLLAGNQACQLGDFFRVTGRGSDRITLEGDLSRVRRIGAGMQSGQITIHGSAGMHLGAGMQGGSIEVSGDAGDWAGAEMRGGKLHIHGDAGDGLGAAYRGSRSGMNRGLILVDGNAGGETGTWMRRGLIAIGGDAGDSTGAFAIAGTILVCGRLGPRSGAGMKRASIVAYRQPQLLPTFRYDCAFHPGFLRLVLLNLRLEGFSIEDAWITGNYLRYSGDVTALGKGEIFIYDQR